MENKFKVGDWLICIEGGRSSSYPCKCTFNGIHNGNSKLMTVDLDRDYPNKEGWGNQRQYRLATPEEIRAAGADWDIDTPETSLKVEDLVEGEVYTTSFVDQGNYIFKFSTTGTEHWLNTLGGGYRYNHSNIRPKNGFIEFRLAKFSERQWLEKCITANKFVPKEEALKEEEFVLPKKWCLELTEETRPVVNKWGKSWCKDWGNLDMNKYVIHPNPTTSSPNGDGLPEITFEQFKKYVLKTPEEVKFEVGKWYKINNCWYAKFMVIHGSGTYWRHSDVITTTGNFCKDPGNLSEDWKSVSMELLTDLSEIQKYLPERHPDKTVEKWSAGTYVVYCKDFIKSVPIGSIRNCNGLGDFSCVLIKDEEGLSLQREERGEIKWFATKEEAEAYSKSITKSSKKEIPAYVECTYNNGTLGDSLIVGHIYKADQLLDDYLYLEGYTIGIYKALTSNFSAICTSEYTGFKPSTKEAYDAQFNTSIPEPKPYFNDEDDDGEPNDFKQASDVSDCLKEQKKSTYIPIYTEPTPVQKVEELVLIKPVIKIKIY